MSSIWNVRRSATDTKVAGLCGGVAEHWDVDPVLVRVGWVLLALSGGVGVVLYLFGWLLIPVTGQSRAPLDDLFGSGARRWPRRVWVVLVVAACVAVFSTFGALSPFGVGPAVILAGIWYFGFYRTRRPQPGTAPSAPDPLPRSVSATAFPTPFSEAAESWRLRIEEHTRQHGAPVPAAPATSASTTWPVLPTPAPTPVQAPAPVPEPDPELAARAAFLAAPDPVGLYAPRDAEDPASAGAVAARPPRGGDRLAARRLRLSALAVLGLVLAGLGFADQSGVSITPAVYAASALLVVGLTLVAATWLGRARGLLPLGLLLVPVVVATTVLGPVTHLDHWTQTKRSYVSVAELPAAGDDLQSGQLVVDLSTLTSAADASYAAHVGTGQLVVVAPVGGNVVVDYQVGVGAVQLGGEQVEGGSHLTGSRPAGTAVPGARTLTLHLSVDRGQLEVRR
ncbi:PspC domain-containing protein [uncultured Friedmanniella sp.]|uniref:PspC domain-containing protein n=1 Tax=uncultured Friedmanniella sp. TaxID=335381 RepID=UPI0035CAB606